MATANRSPKVDAYLAKAQPFARPIVEHVRDLIHRACPGVQETVKWSQPFFEYRGATLCHIGAFKSHCRLHFWGKEITALLREEKAPSFTQIASLEDLPPTRQMLKWFKEAAAIIDRGEYTSPMAGRTKKKAAPPPPEEIPAEFQSALRKNKKAAAIFKAFSASCQREYIEWIAEAKRPETRDKRIATALEWIAEGKQRNWKYQS